MFRVYNFIKHLFFIVNAIIKNKNIKELNEILSYRHVLFVAEKSKLNPKVAMIRHFALFQNFPSIEDCVTLRNEVLEDSEKENPDFKIYWERKRITPDDLIIVGLDPNDSDLFIRGLICDLSKYDTKQRSSDLNE